MRFSTVLLIALVAVFSVPAGPYGSADSTRTIGERTRNMIPLGAMVPPYTWMDTVNVAAANYGVPDSVQVCEMRVLKPGTYQMKLRRSGSRPYVADTSDILRVSVDTIYTTGTTEACRTGSIVLFGIIE
jgi:hypothetical protein